MYICGARLHLRDDAVARTSNLHAYVDRYTASRCSKTLEDLISDDVLFKKGTGNNQLRLRPSHPAWRTSSYTLIGQDSKTETQVYDPSRFTGPRRFTDSCKKSGAMIIQPVPWAASDHRHQKVSPQRRHPCGTVSFVWAKMFQLGNCLVSRPTQYFLALSSVSALSQKAWFSRPSAPESARAPLQR